MKIKELRTQTKNDLKNHALDLKKELIKFNAQIATGTSPKNPGKVKAIKKTLARIETIISEKKEAPQTTRKKT